MSLNPTIAPLPPLATELEEEIFQSVFPNGLPPAKGRSGQSAIKGAFPLEAQHLAKLADHAASGKSLGLVPEPLKAVRATHHKLARLLAMGVDETKAALICNYVPSRVSILKSDPAFIELMNHYALQVDEAFADVVEIAKGISLDALGIIQQRIDENPESITMTQALEIFRTTADRSGTGPTNTQNVNVKTITVSAADLERIKRGSNEPAAIRQVGAGSASNPGTPSAGIPSDQAGGLDPAWESDDQPDLFG